MTVLARALRATLETTVQLAREGAEQGAVAALGQLGVEASAAPSHLDPPNRELRNRLRARARQLGDHRNPKTAEQGIQRLVAETAYEHWHRMLFARFLAENNVLMHPEGVAVTLGECDELAQDEGLSNGWEVAERFAQRMLPQIFRSDSAVLQLRLPMEMQRNLEALLGSLPVEVFGASDALGWVYQFWQAKKRREVNESAVPIGAEELPAITELFTEPYMVDFLLQNTLGAWCVSNEVDRNCPPMPFLLRPEGHPAGGKFEGWPKRAEALNVLDPCCGSGHFLVAAFHLLVPVRMAEEGLTPTQACDAVLRDNLYGLEIDARCTEIAAFALALAAWTYPGSGGYRPLPRINVACSGVAISAKREQWLSLCDGDERLREGMDRLYALFRDAPTLGSLIDPTVVRGTLLEADYSALQAPLTKALAAEHQSADYDTHELGVAALGIAEAATMLGRQYHLVATNVPYLTRNRQGEVLREFCEQNYLDAKTDLATVFLARILRLVNPGGTVAVVVPNIWLTYTKYYENLRRRLLGETQWKLVAQLGKRAFEAISGEIVDVSLFVATLAPPSSDSSIAHMSTADARTAEAKSAHLRRAQVAFLNQFKQLKNPGATLQVMSSSAMTLGAYARAYEGLSRGDTQRFDRKFWELGSVNRSTWTCIVESPARTGPYTGRSTVFRWEKGRGVLAQHPSARVQGLAAWGKPGVIVSRTHLNATLSYGDAFAQNCVCIVPNSPGYLPAVWAYCQSDVYRSEIARLNQKLIKPTGVMVQTPFDLERWQVIGQSGNSREKPSTDDPTQWMFDGSIVDSTQPLQVAVARLVGYRWPNQTDDGLDHLCDSDGIVCLPPVRGEEGAATRLSTLLSSAHGSNWAVNGIERLLSDNGGRGEDLDYWLREKYFEQHCALFEQRPFVWHIWDGIRKGGFSALVNYAKLDRRLLETLTYNYLGDWIKRQEGVRNEGAEIRIAAARGLQGRLAAILEGETPYDIFVRWKPLERQPIGWEERDLDDGVRLNIRPFIEADLLRKSPRVNWKRDQGTDPPGSPWGTERINDRHLTLVDKRAAR